jgi:hypothetical protein
LLKEFEGNENYLGLLLSEWNDTEILVALLESFKEQTENKISTYETTINSEINKDWKDIEQRIIQNQHARNRDII